MIIKQDVGLGENIRRMRKKKGLTQPQVVAKMQVLGCSMCRASYGKIENNKHAIKVSDLIALSNIFGCDFNAFFEGL